VNVFSCGPAGDEHADGHEHAEEQGGQESLFLGPEPVFSNAWVDVEVDPGAVQDDAYAKASSARYEGDAEETEVEVVDVDEDEGKGFEEGVKLDSVSNVSSKKVMPRTYQTVQKPSINAGEGDGWIKEVELEGLDQSFFSNSSKCQTSLVELGLCSKLA
jgi:hypothetical protein